MDEAGDSDATGIADSLGTDSFGADSLGADDVRAIADLRASRVVDSEAVVHRLGGWQAMWSDTATSVSPPAPDRLASLPPRTSLPSAWAADREGAMPLLWTASAATECERLYAIIRTVGEDAAAHFAAAVARTTVRLMVDGLAERSGGIAEREGTVAEREDGIVEVAMLPSLALRVLVTPDGIVVLGLRSTAPIT